MPGKKRNRKKRWRKLQMRKLWFDSSRTLELDSLLLVVAQTGVFLYSAFSIIGASSQVVIVGQFLNWNDGLRASGDRADSPPGIAAYSFPGHTPDSIHPWCLTKVGTFDASEQVIYQSLWQLYSLHIGYIYVPLYHCRSDPSNNNVTSPY